MWPRAMPKSASRGKSRCASSSQRSAESGRPLLQRGAVGRVAPVVGEGLVEPARGDEVVAAQGDDRGVGGVGEVEQRREVVELQVVFAVEARVEREAPEEGALVGRGQLLRFEETPCHGQEGAPLAAAAVPFGRGGEDRQIGGGQLDGRGERGRGERVAPRGGAHFGQRQTVRRLVGSRRDARLGLGAGPVELAGGEQQVPLERLEEGDAPEAQRRRVEQRDGLEGALFAFEQQRQQSHVLRVARVAPRQPAVDSGRLAVAGARHERLAVELQVPLVGRVEPAGRGRQAYALPDAASGDGGDGQLVVGRGAGRVEPDGLGEGPRSAARVAADDPPLDALGVPVEAAERVGHRVGRHAPLALLRPWRPGPPHPGEGRAEEQQREQYGRRTSHGVRAPSRTGAGSGRRSRNRDAGPSRRT